MLLFFATCLYSQDLMSRQPDGSYVGGKGTVARNGVTQLPGVDYVRSGWRVVPNPLYPWSASDTVTVTEINYVNVKDGPGDSLLKYQFVISEADVTSGAIGAPGPQQITLVKCPLGVSGANPKHEVMVDTEKVLLTGGTGGDGCRLEFTTTQAHPSGWQITSTTSGAQEWFYDKAPAFAYFPPGAYKAKGTLYLYGRMGTTVRIEGAGTIASRYERDASFPDGNLIEWDGSIASGELIIRDLGIDNASPALNNTSGSAIRLKTTAPDNILLENITVVNGWNLMHHSGLGILKVNNSKFQVRDTYKYPASHVWIADGQYFQISKTFISNSHQAQPTAALYVSTADGAKLTDSFLSGYVGLQVQSNPEEIINFLYVENNIFDSCRQYGIYFPPGAHNNVFEQFRFTNNHLVHSFRAEGNDSGAGVYIANDPRGMVWTGNNITGWKYSGMVWGSGGVAPIGATVTGNIISNNNARGYGGYGVIMSAGAGYSGTVFNGNTVNNSASVFNPNQHCGFYFSGAGEFNGYTIVGNSLSGNLVANICSDPGATFFNFVAENNAGVTDAFASRDASGQVDIGFYQHINVISGTSITNMVPRWSGRTIAIYNLADTTLSIGGGSVVGPVVDLVKHQSATCTFNGPMAAWMCR